MKHAKSSRVFSLLAFVLAVTMLLTLVGCGGNDADDETPKTTTTTTASTTAGDVGDTTTTTGGDVSDDTTTGTEGGESTGVATLPSLTTPVAPTKTKAPTKTQVKTTRTTVKESDHILNKVPSELKGTKIKMLIWWEKGTDDSNEAKIFADKTGIQVTYETAAMANYQSNLSSKIMSGNPPALAAIINEWYPQPITRGLMQPIKNTGWDYSDTSLYAHALMDQFSYKGEHYGIALKGSNMTTFEVMFFNKKVMKAFGVEKDPYELWQEGNWNWDTCTAIAEKCTDAKKDKYGLTNISQFFWMLSAGQDFVLSDKNGLVNNIKSKDLLDTWYKAWDMIFTNKVIPNNFSNQQQLFFNGSIAMLGAGSYFMQAEASHSNYVPQNVTDEWDVVPYPSRADQAPVAACEGTVWGFPSKVKGNQLQAGMWFLRYFLDDYTYSARDFYPDDELGTHCWDVMSWMWNQKIQSYNSVGVVCYGGKHNAWSIQYSLIDEATTRGQVQSNLESWYTEIQTNIEAINSEMD